MKPPRARATRPRLWLASALLVLGCRSSARPGLEPEGAIPGVTVDAPCVDHRCGEGLMCRQLERKGAGAARDRCVLEPGRCRDDWDCVRSVQRCRRFGTRLGVCQDGL